MRLGDRKYAYKVRDIHGMQNILIDFVPRRNMAEVYLNKKIDVTSFCKFIDKLKKDYPDITYFHGMSFILAKTIYSKPYLNRFISDRVMYEHKDVSLSFVAKQNFKDDSVEYMTVVPFNKGDNIISISEFVANKVAKIRAGKINGDDIDGLVDRIGKMPKIFRIPFTGFVKFLDRKGLLPKSFCEGNVYYASGLVSNLGTFGMDGIYHHLSEFGTNSFVVTFGEIRTEGNKKVMNIGVTLDERIADGFYFCKAFNVIEYLFNNPELLMEDVSIKVDINKKRI